ncbi:MAG: endonuclease MutS2 [Chloroflexi bacterium]|nr:endonuclease MutS2 [Chloroflexota bacterium]
MRVMENLAGRDSLKPFLQSDAIASRGDRLVLEVKSSHRVAVPGIVHDVSSSGQTAFIEPFAVVDVANDWREAAYEAEKEEERVLRKLSRSVAVRGEDALASMQAAASLDAAVARGRLSLKIGGVRPKTGGISPSDDSDGLMLVEARHPLIGEEVVPISMHLDTKRRGLVITGPNTGGKTIALKTLGLMALMHQSGLQIPAREASELPVFDGVFADIGDAQSIDRSVSTFSSHMERVIRIIERATDRSLVLLDELGTGTDPEEGSALARAILERLVSEGVWTCVTTHHRPVSEYAATHDSLGNASVELDPESMLPNYRLIMGLPGQSYAMEVAKRLGLEEPIVEHAESMLDPLRSQTESLLKSLQTERDRVREVQQQTAEDRAEAERLRIEARANLAESEQERDKAIEEARDQLKREAQRVRRQLRRLMREAQRQQTWQEARESAADIARSVGSEDWLASADRPRRTDGRSPSDDSPEFNVGDSVRVESLGVTGEIVEMDRDNRAVVLSGTMRFQARPHMMTLVKAGADAKEAERPQTHARVQPKLAHVADAAGDLDVRGSRVHMVESMIPQFIDRAFMQGLTSVRIIHGEGSGALRHAVRDILSREPHVETFQPAPQNAGGNGVTVAMLE